MSVKTKIDVFPFEGYLLQDPSVVSVMQAVVRGKKGGGSSGTNDGSGTANKRRDGIGNNAQAVERRLRTPLEKLMSLKARCREEQCVHSVEGVLLVHVHDHPHVLLLRYNTTKSSTQQQQQQRVLPATNTNNMAVFRLPGGRCRKGEPEDICLLRKLGRDLLNEVKCPPSSTRTAETEQSDTVVEVGTAHSGATAVGSSSSFRVGETLARWYRPHFDPFMYPYIPAHVAESDIKEVRTVFLVHMPPQMMLTIANRDVQLVAAPLFDLYDNAAKYGPLIASIPTLLSRVNINYCK